MIPLPFLQAGEGGRIAEVAGQGDFVDRLRELGICIGARIEMVRCGDPCIVRLGGQKLCLRSEELNLVLVEIQELHSA